MKHAISGDCMYIYKYIYIFPQNNASLNWPVSGAHHGYLFTDWVIGTDSLTSYSLVGLTYAAVLVWLPLTCRSGAIFRDNKIDIKCYAREYITGKTISTCMGFIYENSSHTYNITWEIWLKKQWRPDELQNKMCGYVCSLLAQKYISIALLQFTKDYL